MSGQNFRAVEDQTLAVVWPRVEADIVRLTARRAPVSCPAAAPTPGPRQPIVDRLVALAPGQRLTVFSTTYPNRWIDAARGRVVGDWSAKPLGNLAWIVERVR